MECVKLRPRDQGALLCYPEIGDRREAIREDNPSVSKAYLEYGAMDLAPFQCFSRVAGADR